MAIIKKVSKKYNLKFVRFLIIYLLLAAISATANVFITKTATEMSDMAIRNDIGNLSNTLFTLAILTSITVIFSFLSTILKDRKNAKYGYIIRGSYISYLLNISQKDSKKQKVGETLSLYSTDLPHTASLLTTEFLTILSGLFIALLSVYFMFRINVWITIIYLCLYPLASIIQMKLATPIQDAARQSNLKKAEFNNVVNDCLQNTSLVLSYNLEDALEERYQKSFSEYEVAARKRFSIFASLVIKGMLLTQIPIFFVNALAAYSAFTGGLSYGQFLMYTTMALSAQAWIQMLSQYTNIYQMYKGGATRFLDSLIYGEEKDEEKIYNISKENAVDIKNVSFSYDGERNVLNNISLSIPKGSTVAMVGKSGCGKSTLAKLILGLEKQNTGSISYFDESNENTSSVFSLISYVPQDCFLLSESIKDNIISNDKNPDMYKLSFSMETACINDFVNNLNEKENYILTDGGENISGGQKQRIALARAVYHDKPILLLDEATSALDTATEKTVMDNISKLNNGKTKIIITHRLENIKNADCIYYLENGEIKEKGSFNELISLNGEFKALVEKQKMEEKDEK